MVRLQSITPERCLLEGHRNADDRADCNAPAQHRSACNRGNTVMHRPFSVVQARPITARRKGGALGSYWVGGCRKELRSHARSKPCKDDRVELRFCISDGAPAFCMVSAPTFRAGSAIAPAFRNA